MARKPKNQKTAESMPPNAMEGASRTPQAPQAPEAAPAPQPTAAPAPAPANVTALDHN